MIIIIIILLLLFFIFMIFILIFAYFVSSNVVNVAPVLVHFCAIQFHFNTESIKIQPSRL